MTRCIDLERCLDIYNLLFSHRGRLADHKIAKFSKDFANGYCMSMTLLLKSIELNQEATIWLSTPINRHSLMPKPLYKTTNRKKYNKALINRGSLVFWIDEEEIAGWKQNKQGKRVRLRRFSDLAVTTALMVKRIFSVPSRAL